MENNPVYSVVISSKAQREMAASWLWYEEREEGLGDRLFSAVINKLNSIAKNPDAFSIKCRPYIKYTKNM